LALIDDTALQSSLVFSMHSDYAASRADFAFLMDSYRGTGGYEDGRYLDPHPREKRYDSDGTTVLEVTDKFNDRRKRAYYPNIIKSIVDIPVQYVYQSTIRRDGAKEWTDFVKDCNGRGVPLNSMMKSLMGYARLFGHMFALIDKPATPANVSTRGDQQRAGLKPRLIPIYPSDVVDWFIEDGVLKWVKIIERHQTGGTPFAQVTMGYRVRVWTETEWFLYEVATVDMAIKNPFAGSAPGQEKINFPEASPGDTASPAKTMATLVKQGTHSVGKVPLVGVYNEEPEFGSLYATTDVYQSARTNRRLYNLVSELDEIIRDQTFSILCIPTEDGTDQGFTKTIGVRSGLLYKAVGGQGPHFISPDGGCADTIRQQIIDLRLEIYRAAHLQYAEGFQQVRSGVAKQWNFDQTNRFLGTLAKRGETAEQQIGDIVMRWHGKTPTDADVVVEYPGQFNISDILDEIETTDMIIAMRISKQFSVKVAQDLVTKKFPNLPKVEREAIFKEIEASDMISPPQAVMTGPNAAAIGGRGSIAARVRNKRGAGVDPAAAAAANNPAGPANVAQRAATATESRFASDVAISAQ
jgi:hypothetical protein